MDITPQQARQELARRELARRQVKTSEQEPFQPTFKASIGGGETILPNTLKTLGNVPSNTASLVNTAGQATFGNAANIIKTGTSIFKEQGFKEGIKNIASGFADTAAKIFKAPGEFLVNEAQKNELVAKLSPIQKNAIQQRDLILKHLQEAKDSGRDTSSLVKALKYNQEVLGDLESQISTPEQRKLKEIEDYTKVAKYPIERPVDTALALETGGPKSNISKVSSPVTRGADTSVLGLASKGKTVIMKNQVPKAIDNLEAKYIEWSGGTKPGKKLINNVEKRTDMLNAAGTEGRTPMRVLAEDGIVPETSGTKFNTYDQANTYREGIKKLREANIEAIKEAELFTPKVKLSDLEKKALSLANTEKNIAGGSATKLTKDIQNEFADLRAAYGDEVYLGKVNEIKEARWEESFKNKGLVDADKLRKNSDYLIGKASQKTIENVAEVAGNKELAQLNREIGDRLEGAKFLESLDGKTLKGGRLGKYVGTIIGSTMGQTLPGKILGALGGNAVADLLIKASVNSPIRRIILNGLKTKDPAAYEATIKWLAEQDASRSTRLALPPPTTQYVGPTQAGLPYTPNKAGFTTSPVVETRGIPKAKGEIPPTKEILKSKSPLASVIKDTGVQKPTIQLKRDVTVTTLTGEKVVIDSGEVLKAYESGGKALLKDGREYVVSKSQYENIKNNSLTSQAKEFAPELKGTEETVKGTQKMAIRDKAYADFDAGKITREQRNAIIDKLGVPNETKYSNYQLPDGKNYKEILIKAPVKDAVPMEWKQARNGDYNSNVNGRDITITKEGSKFYVYEKSGVLGQTRNTLQEAKDTAWNYSLTQRDKGFKSSHWDEPNVISHIRMNERTYQGKKVAFMEELQSDWARELKSGKTTVSNPMVEKGKWVEPTIKRALQEAVDSKAEYFSWINGEQTSARYNLATQVDSVKWNTGKNGFDGKMIYVNAKEGRDIIVKIDDKGKIIKGQTVPNEWEGKTLDQAFGKGLADKIMEKESGTLSGEGLKFGGEWANNLYDKQVGNIVSDLTGAKVEKLDLGLPVEKGGPEFHIMKYPNSLPLTKENIKVGLDVSGQNARYIITDILGDGKFKAIPKSNITTNTIKKLQETGRLEGEGFTSGAEQTFDISSKKTTQQGIRLTPEIKAKIKGEAPKFAKSLPTKK